MSCSKLEVGGEQGRKWRLGALMYTLEASGTLQSSRVEQALLTVPPGLGPGGPVAPKPGRGLLSTHLPGQQVLGHRIDGVLHAGAVDAHARRPKKLGQQRCPGSPKGLRACQWGLQAS